MLPSFLPCGPQCDFPLNNLAYGVVSTAADPRPRPAVAIADHVLDLRTAHKCGLLAGPILSQRGAVFEEATLNGFMALGRPAWAEARATLTRLLSAGEGVLRDNPDLQRECLIPQAGVRLHLPAAIGDYTDFYCSLEHATNMGVMWRGEDNPLQPNWRHMPVGYHGRASSIVLSGTDVRRPLGQLPGVDGGPPTFGPSRALDFELELGCLVGPGNELGAPIPLDRAADHIFGYVLVNDWSARDIQRWEYVPLGPFNGKNFATSISPWVVTPDALEPFRCEALPQDLPPLPYLRGERWGYELRLEVDLEPEGDQVTTVTRSGLDSLYWTVPQMLAHHTAGGCNLRPGDLIATGTLSTAGPSGGGALIELTWGGTRPVGLAGGGQRTYLEDGDAIVMRGWCAGPDGSYRVGFGECRGRVLPAAAG